MTQNACTVLVVVEPSPVLPSRKRLAHIDTTFKVFQLHLAIYTPLLGLIAC